MKNESIKELRVCRIYLRGDILITEINDGAEVEADDINEIHQAALQLAGGSVTGMLILAEMPFLLSASARNAAAQLCSLKGVKGAAICTDITSVRMMVSFFNRINRPVIPVRIFAEKQAAEDWLQQLAMN
ncbi:MAG: STAS/SEC14 domain-containing protein [Bacteroidetes bacterium]|nr:STAS/SEC14 domain-containing protein [Bacteroidota bacterium]